MDEGRKRVLLIAAAILAARKLSQYEGPARVPASIYAVTELFLLITKDLVKHRHYEEDVAARRGPV
jgi:hypothetical protein